MKHISISNILNGVLLALILGVGSWAYSAVEKVESLKTEQAVSAEKQNRLESDVREVKQDIKEIKEKQDRASQEQNKMLQEILENTRKK